MTVTTVAVAGSTGSIGTQTLEVVKAEPGRFRVTAMAATARNLELVLAQVAEVQPELVVLVGADPEAARAVESCARGVEVAVEPAALELLASAAAVVVNGIVGFAGLPVTLATLEAGRRLALANKESLIAAGPVVQQARRTAGAELVPVDSEHGALHQCLRANAAEHPERVSRLLLTASGGPFRGRSAAELASVTVEEALSHPTWAMGPKITVDSSTLMNKGLEVIEAHELFGHPAGAQGFELGLDDIDVVVHPQSVVHSMVDLSDGTTMAQLSMPDMRLPIGYALAYPDRLATPFGRIDWTTVGRLDFEAPDHEAFPCLGLAYDAGRLGQTAPAWLSAANEVAVEAFLGGRIRWNQIAETNARALEHYEGTPATHLDVVIEADRRSREVTRRIIDRKLSAA